MRNIILLAICLLLFSVAASAQIRSVYTTTKSELCRTIESTADEGGSYEGECPGVGGYKVRLLEGDIRQTLNIVTPAKKTFELNFWSFFGGFSAIHTKIEWRVKGTVPIALIARYNVARSDDSQKSDSYLMVSKIGKTGSCVVGTVGAGAKQNEEARAMADKAQSMPCLRAD